MRLKNVKDYLLKRKLLNKLKTKNFFIKTSKIETRISKFCVEVKVFEAHADVKPIKNPLTPISRMLRNVKRYLNIP